MQTTMTTTTSKKVAASDSLLRRFFVIRCESLQHWRDTLASQSCLISRWRKQKVHPSVLQAAFEEPETEIVLLFTTNFTYKFQGYGIMRSNFIFQEAAPTNNSKSRGDKSSVSPQEASVASRGYTIERPPYSKCDYTSTSSIRVQFLAIHPLFQAPQPDSVSASATDNAHRRQEQEQEQEQEQTSVTETKQAPHDSDKEDRYGVSYARTRHLKIPCDKSPDKSKLLESAHTGQEIPQNVGLELMQLIDQNIIRNVTQDALSIASSITQASAPQFSANSDTIASSAALAATESVQPLPSNPTTTHRKPASSSSSSTAKVRPSNPAASKDTSSKSEQKDKESQHPSFYETDSTDIPQVFAALKKKVDTLGKTLCAVLVGSRRYNLNVADSDLDFLIVFASKTEDVLSLSPPPTIYKNPPKAHPDLTVIEVSRFLQLLLSGDTRIVETLFVLPEDTIFTTPEFQELQQFGTHFLTKTLVQRYLSDIRGPNKLGSLTSKKEYTPRELKTWYMTFNLLFHAQQVAKGEALVIKYADDSPERKFIMSIRQGKCDQPQLMKQAHQMIETIEQHLAAPSSLPQSPSRTKCADELSLEAQRLVQNWLMSIRKLLFS